MVINQCQGCMAGWELVNKDGFFGEPLEYHKVEGGYTGEIVACTRKDYEKFKTNEETSDESSQI